MARKDVGRVLLVDTIQQVEEELSSTSIGVLMIQQASAVYSSNSDVTSDLPDFSTHLAYATTHSVVYKEANAVQYTFLSLTTIVLTM